MAHDQLLDLLVQHSYRFSEKAIYKLASGRMSQFYVQCKTTTMRRDAARLIADAFRPHVPPSAQAVGGLTMGADPIAYAIRDLSGLELDAFVVRKEAKEHGLKDETIIEGPTRRGMKVVVVDDVVTTGGSTIQAIRECVRAGFEIVSVVVLVDREEDGGLDAVKSKVRCPVSAIFTLPEIHARWLERGHDAHTDTARPAAVAV